MMPNLKILPEHYKWLKAEIATMLDARGLHMTDLRADYEARGLSETRLMFDVWTASGLPGVSRRHHYHLHGYMNDNHMETALKRICRELETQ